MRWTEQLHRNRIFYLGLVLSIGFSNTTQNLVASPLNARRILFLGDSITHNGQYVAWIATQLRLQGLMPMPEIINIGLSSETCCGLTEKGHPFPRPDVHDRLDRALRLVKPDLVVACYGMNDGIYHPLGTERFQAFQDGIQTLINKVQEAGAKVVLLTPPPFDPLPLRDKGVLKSAVDMNQGAVGMFENYDAVLTRYSKWIMQQRDQVDMVIDVHQPMMQYVAEQRKQNPEFTMASDGVHPNTKGHQLMGNAILRAWGLPSTIEPSAELITLMNRKMSLLHDAWLSKIGHQRPGVKPGLPLDEALVQANELNKQIDHLVHQANQANTSVRQSTGGEIHQVHFPPSAKPGELRIAADYYLWVPENVQEVRGVILHQHGCGVGASIGGRTAADDLHWQALARKWDCVLMGSSYEPLPDIDCWTWCDPRRGSGDRFLQALSILARSSDHPEIESAPWCLWGHSGGGFWASLMQTKYPERIVAVWLRSGTAFGQWTRGEVEKPDIQSAVFGVPVLANPGLKEKDDQRFGRLWDGLVAMQQVYRKEGAFFLLAPDPNTLHECGDSRYLAIPYFDFWLQNRLPTSDGDAHGLQPVAEGREKWEAVMSHRVEQYMQTGGVDDTTPPPAPYHVKATREGNHVTVTWDANADLESGIRCFQIQRDGKRIGQVPAQPIGRFGRPLFQTMSYHDTPEQPLPKMIFVDQHAPADHLPTYQVRTVNSVGLESPASASK